MKIGVDFTRNNCIAAFDVFIYITHGGIGVIPGCFVIFLLVDSLYIVMSDG